MPVPGPRHQWGPEPGYRNPRNPNFPAREGEIFEEPHRLQLWLRPPPVAQEGRSPGLMAVDLRGNVLARGMVRTLWRQMVNYIPATPPYSWTASAPAPGRPFLGPGAFHITRALRYMTRCVYVQEGTDNTRFYGWHTAFPPQSRQSANARGRRVTVGAGQHRQRPTVRNRMSSFGSRVPTLNPHSPSAQEDR